MQILITFNKRCNHDVSDTICTCLFIYVHEIDFNVWIVLIKLRLQYFKLLATYTLFLPAFKQWQVPLEYG